MFKLFHKTKLIAEYKTHKEATWHLFNTHCPIPEDKKVDRAEWARAVFKDGWKIKGGKHNEQV